MIFDLVSTTYCNISVYDCVGKGGGEEEKKEFKMEREPPATHEEGKTYTHLSRGTYTNL